MKKVSFCNNYPFKREACRNKKRNERNVYLYAHQPRANLNFTSPRKLMTDDYKIRFYTYIHISGNFLIRRVINLAKIYIHSYLQSETL